MAAKLIAMNTPSSTLDTKVSVDTIVQLFHSLASGLMAIVADAR
jgi:hypothetical protein